MEGKRKTIEPGQGGGGCIEGKRTGMWPTILKMDAHPGWGSKAKGAN